MIYARDNFWVWNTNDIKFALSVSYNWKGPAWNIQIIYF